MSLHSAGKLFQVCFISSLALTSCSKAWTLSHLQCVLSAAACVVIGWQPSFPLASIWGAGRASRLGRVRLSRGCGRRYLRRNLSLTEKPLPSRRNMELHGSKARSTCVRDWRFFGSGETNILSLRCHSPTFNTSTSSMFCVPRLDEEQRLAQS